jgi:hypothetical protein
MGSNTVFPLRWNTPANRFVVWSRLSYKSDLSRGPAQRVVTYVLAPHYHMPSPFKFYLSRLNLDLKQQGFGRR